MPNESLLKRIFTSKLSRLVINKFSPIFSPGPPISSDRPNPVPPRFDESVLHSESNVTVREFDDVNIPCSASGNPKPTIYWKREDFYLSESFATCKSELSLECLTIELIFVQIFLHHPYIHLPPIRSFLIVVSAHRRTQRSCQPTAHRLRLQTRLGSLLLLGLERRSAIHKPANQFDRAL